MGKSSSSLKKKKRSKIYSQARIKKRSKSRTRRSYKLKKLRHRDGSVSYSSDDNDSRSSVSISSSSPEDDNRSKRSRSRTRKDVKGSKKRTRRQSSSHESLEDSPRVKKRKASRKNDDSRVKKKRLEKKKKKKKKKSVRDMSASSTSSMSWSCSTCHGSSGESEIEKKRGRSERKGKDMRRRGEKVENKSKMRRSRSSSRSSLFSQFSEYSDHKIDDTIVRETNSRRLRSVITVVREGEDMTGMFNDEHKEEMVYDHDDYPSSRSNDSNDGGSKRELVHNSHVASEGKKHPEDGKGEALSNIRTFKVSESDGDIEGHDGSNPRCDGFEMNGNEKGKKNQDSGGIDIQSGHDLELILRQKALENLRIRRGHQAGAKVYVNEKDVISCEINTSTTNFGSSQNRFSEGGGASDVAKRSSISPDLLQNDDKISKGNGNGKGSGSAKHDVQNLPRQLARASNPKEIITVPVSSETNHPGSVVLASNPELTSASTIKKQLHTLHEPPQTTSITRDNVGKSMIETMPTVNSLSGNNNGEETNNVSVSGDPPCIKSPCGGTSSNKPQDETSEGSQYQQKTMTVMRGGEMVEVSYKVYIPKKAPALARRQLKR